jgi:hypothetical protein
MTDQEALLSYRLREAIETLAESKRMIEEGFSARSVINRSIFDREFVLTGKLDPRHSKTFHRMFEARQKADYRELVDVSADEAMHAVGMAEEFLAAVRELIGPVTARG